MDYIVKTEHFEGPFDLLLELIKKREMNIFDLQISQITKDYLENLDALRERSAEVNSEFMDLASLLLQIKTRMLIPAEQEKGDPRDELVRQLMEFKEMKEAAEKLREMKEMENKLFKRQRTETVKKFRKGSASDLYKSFMAIFLNKKPAEKNNPLDELKIHLAKFKYTIDDRIEHLKGLMEGGARIAIASHFSKIDDKEEMIVTFGALLELVKTQHINIFIEENGSVFIEGKGEAHG